MTQIDAMYQISLMQTRKNDEYVVKVEDAEAHELSRYRLVTENYSKAWKHAVSCFKRLKIANPGKSMDYYIEGPYNNRAIAIYGHDDLDRLKIEANEKDFYTDLMDKYLALRDKSYFANKAFRVVALQNNLNIQQENKLFNFLLSKKAI